MIRSGRTQPMGSTSPTVKADFLADLRDDVTRLLNQAGVSVPDDADVSRVCRMFLNLKRRLVEPARRIVHQSKELDARKLTSDQLACVPLIPPNSIAGEHLTGYLSTKLEKAEHHDM